MRKTSKLNLVAPATDRKQDYFRTPAERVALLKLKIPGKDIETLYVHMNQIKIRKAHWQDGHVTGALLDNPPSPLLFSRHVSIPVSDEPCAVELRV